MLWTNCQLLFNRRQSEVHFCLERSVTKCRELLDATNSENLTHDFHIKFLGIAKPFTLHAARHVTLNTAMLHLHANISEHLGTQARIH